MSEQTKEEKAETLRLTLNAVLQHMGPATLEVVEAHIAALTAERDEARRLALATDQHRSEWGEECDALRERVKALEAELTRVRGVAAEYRELIRDARRRGNAAKSRLATIRQWVRSDPSTPETQWWAGYDDAKQEVRDLLGDDTPAGVKGSHKLGTNSPPASEWLNTCEHGDHPAPEGERFCSAACATCEGADHDGDGCANLCDPAPADVDPRTFGDVPPPSEMDGLRGEMAEAPKGTCQCGDERCPLCCPPSKPAAPTTSEAFSLALGGIRHAPACTTTPGSPVCGCGAIEARSALSLLEGRMGAQEAVLRALLSSGVDSQWVEGGRRVGLCAMARAALADAPPVFTPEEVQGVVDGVFNDTTNGRETDPQHDVKWFYRQVSARLTALRR